MKRRRLLTIAGSVVTGSTILGTTAFSSTEARRSVSLNVANDKNAFLELEPTGDYADRTNEMLIEFNIDEVAEAEGTGVGPNSEYEFIGVFAIWNRGTDPVRVFGKHDDEVPVSVAIGRNGEILTAANPSEPVPSGEGKKFDLFVETDGDIGEFDTTIDIVAFSADSERFA